MIDPEGELSWFWGPQSATRGQRGFCRRCGSSLFWRTPERETVSITAGTLAGAAGPRLVPHIWGAARAGWGLVEDGGPRGPRGGGGRDGATGLRIVQHIWDEQRADWELVDDGVARVPRGT